MPSRDMSEDWRGIFVLNMVSQTNNKVLVVCSLTHNGYEDISLLAIHEVIVHRDGA